MQHLFPATIEYQECDDAEAQAIENTFHQVSPGYQNNGVSRDYDWYVKLDAERLRAITGREPSLGGLRISKKSGNEPEISPRSPHYKSNEKTVMVSPDD